MRFIKAIKAFRAVAHGSGQKRFPVRMRARVHQGSGPRPRRQTRLGRSFSPAVLAVALPVVGGLLAGCSSGGGDGRVLRGEVVVDGFTGLVVADEPRAALVGRDVLGAGGTAADAAAAMGFALSVTLPSSAGLGGGGVCVVWDSEEKKAHALDFLPRAPQGAGEGGTYRVALPGTPRGLFALQSRYGTLRWERIIAPAENLARFGVRTSRALARDFAVSRDALVREPETLRVFGRDQGRTLAGEGDHLEQLDLAAMLGRLRMRGAGDFYLGASARQYIEAVRAGGGSLDAKVLRDYVPQWVDPVTVEAGDHVAAFAPPPAAGGLVAADMFAMLVDEDRYEDADVGERHHLLAEAATRSYGDRAGWMRRDGTAVVAPSRVVFPARVKDMMKDYDPDRHTPADTLAPPPKAQAENPTAASLVAVDADGDAVACSLTLGNPFGIGRMARGTGILPAAVPDVAGRGFLALGPMVVGNPNTGAFHWGGAASGGITASTSLVGVAADTVLGEVDLNVAMSQARVHTTGDPDIVYYEQAMDGAAVKALSARGHRVAATPNLGRVIAASCPEGLPPRFSDCQVKNDPRGHGLAVNVR